MVTAVQSTPSVLRVSYLERDGDLTQSEVVCYVRPHPHIPGLQVSYSHHLVRNRDVPKGVWISESRARHAMTPELKAQIWSCVMLEVWSTFCQEIDVIYSDAGAPPRWNT